MVPRVRRRVAAAPADAFAQRRVLARDRERPVHPTDSPHPVTQLQRLAGNRATSRVIQRLHKGSFNAFASGAAEELVTDAADKTFAPNWASNLGEGGPPGIGGSLRSAAAGPHQTVRLEQLPGRKPSWDFVNPQHPAFAGIGTRSGGTGSKRAVFIANMGYSGGVWKALSTPETDANAVRSAVTKKGYPDSEPLKNQTGAAITQQLDQAIAAAGEQAAAGGSPELFLFYAGHGIEQGMVGTDAARPTPPHGELGLYTTILSRAEAAAQQGAHITFLSDACRSGALTDLVRARAIELMPKGGDPRLDEINENLRMIDELIVEFLPQGSGDGQFTPLPSAWYGGLGPIGYSQVLNAGFAQVQGAGAQARRHLRSLPSEDEAPENMDEFGAYFDKAFASIGSKKQLPKSSDASKSFASNGAPGGGGATRGLGRPAAKKADAQPAPLSADQLAKQTRDYLEMQARARADVPDAVQKEWMAPGGVGGYLQGMKSYLKENGIDLPFEIPKGPPGTSKRRPGGAVSAADMDRKDMHQLLRALQSALLERVRDIEAEAQTPLKDELPAPVGGEAAGAPPKP